MATIEELSAALVKADAAGNSSDAKAFADEIRKMKAQPIEKPQTSLMQDIKQGAGNFLAGGVRGAGSIGSTLISAGDLYSRVTNPQVATAHAQRGIGLSNMASDVMASDKERRALMDQGLQTIGAQPESLLFKTGKLAGEIAGTAGTGGAIAKGLGLAKVSPQLLSAIRTGGFNASGAGIGTRALGGAISGGASAGLIEPENTLVGAALGGALPATTALAVKAGGLIRKAVTKGGASPEVAALANRAKELGIDIPADRLIDSKPLNAIASSLNYVPMSGRAATESKMSEQLNTAASKLIGQDTPNINKALRSASIDLGQKFDTVLKGNTLAVDRQFVDDISNVFNTAQKELGSDALKPIASQVDELFAKGSSGAIDGQAAYNIKRTLDRIGSSNRPEAFHALELKGKLMEALDRSLGEEGAKAFAKTRQQYGNMLALEKIAKNGAEGELSIARLANMKNINNQPLQELADIASQFVKAREGQHGAMQRAIVGGSAAMLGGPAGLAAGAGAGRATNALLNSKMLKNAMLNTPREAGNSKLLEAIYKTSPAIVSRSNQ